MPILPNCRPSSLCLTQELRGSETGPARGAGRATLDISIPGPSPAMSTGQAGHTAASQARPQHYQINATRLLTRHWSTAGSHLASPVHSSPWTFFLSGASWVLAHSYVSWGRSMVRRSGGEQVEKKILGLESRQLEIRAGRAKLTNLGCLNHLCICITKNHFKRAIKWNTIKYLCIGISNTSPKSNILKATQRKRKIPK